MKEYIFVYGQFRDLARNLLGDFTFCGKSSVKGKIYRVNDSYPGYVNGDGIVYGDIYLIDNSVLSMLDEFEGDEYQRVKIKTLTDLDCWIYKYIKDVNGFKEIKGGDWLLR